MLDADVFVTFRAVSRHYSDSAVSNVPTQEYVAVALAEGDHTSI